MPLYFSLISFWLEIHFVFILIYVIVSRVFELLFTSLLIHSFVVIEKYTITQYKKLREGIKPTFIQDNFQHIKKRHLH